MRKIKLILMTELTKKRDGYKKQLEKSQAKIKNLREKLTSERNREQYLNRCIKALNERIGDIKEGQLEFKI